MKKAFCKVALVVVMLVGFSCYAHAGSWVLTYETDASGNVVYGNVSDLIGAVEAAANVKVVMDWSSVVGQPKKGIYTCESVQTNTGYVACVLPDELARDSWSFDIFDNSYIVAALVNSNGHVMQNRWYLDGSYTHYVKTDNLVPMKWYVE